MRLVIDRQKWLRGEGNYHSALLRGRDNRMCCFGFYGRACGLDNYELLEKKSLLYEDIRHRVPAWATQREAWDTSDADLLMKLNDCEHLKDEHRETAIANIFATHGVEVEFIN